MFIPTDNKEGILEHGVQYRGEIEPAFESSPISFEQLKQRATIVIRDIRNGL